MTQRNETLSPAAAAVLADPPPCLVFYEGLTCASLRRDGQARAPVCQTIRERLEWLPLATTAFASRIYDPVNAGYLRSDADGRTATHTMLPEQAPVSLTAFRARRAAAAP